MSAAVWNEPLDPERRFQPPRRTVGAPWDTSILIVCAPPGEPRQAEPTARR